MIPKIIKTFQLTFRSLQLHDSHSVKSSEPPSLVFSRFSKPNFCHVSTIGILSELLQKLAKYITEGVLHLPSQQPHKIYKYEDVYYKHIQSLSSYKESHSFTALTLSIQDTLTAYNCAKPHEYTFHEVFYIKLNYWCPCYQLLRSQEIGL